MKILWKIFQIDSTIFQICAHSKHSHPKKPIIILAFCSLIRTFATDKRVLTSRIGVKSAQMRFWGMPKMPINKGILKEIEWQIPVLKVLGLNPNGITKEKGELNMKACFQIFKAPFYFVGWLAPAYRDRWNQSQRDHERQRVLKDEYLFSNSSGLFGFCRMAGASLQG